LFNVTVNGHYAERTPGLARRHPAEHRADEADRREKAKVPEDVAFTAIQAVPL